MSTTISNMPLPTLLSSFEYTPGEYTGTTNPVPTTTGAEFTNNVNPGYIMEAMQTSFAQFHLNDTDYVLSNASGTIHPGVLAASVHAHVQPQPTSTNATTASNADQALAHPDLLKVKCPPRPARSRTPRAVPDRLHEAMSRLSIRGTQRAQAGRKRSGAVSEYMMGPVPGTGTGTESRIPSGLRSQAPATTRIATATGGSSYLSGRPGRHGPHPYMRSLRNSRKIPPAAAATESPKIVWHCDIEGNMPTNPPNQMRSIRPTPTFATASTTRFKTDSDPFLRSFLLSSDPLIFPGSVTESSVVCGSCREEINLWHVTRDAYGDAKGSGTWICTASKWKSHLFAKHGVGASMDFWERWMRFEKQVEDASY
jgi:hypothetical protein